MSRVLTTNVRPRLLDLFCGAGGAAMGYHRAGFEVVGVDHRAQPRYPFEFIHADALGFTPLFITDYFDAIHASPPCQAHSVATSRNRLFMERERAQPGLFPRHLDLIDQTRDLLVESGLPYVIENVIGAPLRSAAMLCGSSFGLNLRRHRLFETNWGLASHPCNHGWQTPQFPPNDSRRNGQLASVVTVGGHLTYTGEWDHWQEAMGVDWMKPRELAQAIPPAYTYFIGAQLLAHVRELHPDTASIPY